MSTEPDRSTQPDRTDQQFKRIVVTLMSIVTILSALTAFLQTASASRSSTAVRNSQRHALSQVETALQTQQQQNYDLYVYEQWSSLLAQRLVQLGSSRGISVTSPAQHLSDLMQLTANFSPLTQPPYLTDPINGLLDLARYYADNEYQSTYWRQRREASAAEGEIWGRKAAAYVMVLSLLAVALFLLGLAATIGGQLRGAFVILGGFFAVIGTVWMLFTAIIPVPVRTDLAMQTFARGHRNIVQGEILRGWDQITAAMPQLLSGIDEMNKALQLDPNYGDALNERAFAYLIAAELQVFSGQDAHQLLSAAVADFQATVDLGRTDLTTLWNLGYAEYLLGDYANALNWTERAIDRAPQQVGLYLNRAAALLGLGRRSEALTEVDHAVDQAVQQPISTAYYYFRQAIYDLTLLSKARPAMALDDLLVYIKEKYVSLRYRHLAPPQAVDTQITNLRFGSELNTNNDVLNFATTFPARTEKVFVAFDYAALPVGGEIDALVYRNDREDDTLSSVGVTNLSGTGSAWLQIITPFINAGGLTSGHYRADIYVAGKFLASAEFDIQ